ncbi:MAG: conjugal transfer protein TraF [Planctomycetes bacterium]|nr:conjugal transfer protein TraF [Planctomycetota bacterium]
MRKSLLIKFNLCCVFVILVVGSASLHADEWIIYGARLGGMGGAGVAAVNGANSTYWNPANLWHYDKGILEQNKTKIAEPGSREARLQSQPQTKRRGRRTVNYATNSTWDFTVNINITPAFIGDTVEHLDAIYSIWQYLEDEDMWDYLDEALGTPTPNWNYPGHEMTAEYMDAVYALFGSISALNHDGRGVTVGAAAGMNFRLGNFGFHSAGITYLSAYPKISFPFGGITSQLLDDFVADLIAQGYIDANAIPETSGGETLQQQILDAKAQLGITDDATAAILAAFFEEASENTLFDLDEKFIRDGILLMLEAESAFAEEEAFDNNDTYISLQGLMVVEAAFSYAHAFEIDHSNVDQIQVGGSLKLLFGRTFDDDIYMHEFDESMENVVEDFSNTWNSNVYNEMNFTFDLGVTAVLLDYRLRVSAVGKNITQPKFEYGANESLQIKGQYRIGAAFDIIKNMLVASLDMDLFPRETTYLPGYNYMALAIGIEGKPISNNIFGMAIRAGFLDNIASTDDSSLYTIGLGFRLFFFQLDFSGGFTPYTKNAADSEAVYYQNSVLADNSIPARISFGISLSANATW